jgi:hypothetical protein
MELATGASDRRTKVLAMELLHFYVLYMVGCNAAAGKSKAQPPVI